MKLERDGKKASRAEKDDYVVSHKFKPGNMGEGAKNEKKVRDDSACMKQTGKNVQQVRDRMEDMKETGKREGK